MRCIIFNVEKYKGNNDDGTCLTVQSSIILILCFMFACANGMTQLNSIGFREYPLLGFVEFH